MTFNGESSKVGTKYYKMAQRDTGARGKLIKQRTLAAKIVIGLRSRIKFTGRWSYHTHQVTRRKDLKEPSGAKFCSVAWPTWLDDP